MSFKKWFGYTFSCYVTSVLNVRTQKPKSTANLIYLEIRCINVNIIFGDTMNDDGDFIWDESDSTSNNISRDFVPIRSKTIDKSIKKVEKGAPHIDVNAEIDELVETFKHKIADIISREANKK